MSELDKRVNAYRNDLADVSLQELVDAKEYVKPSLRQVTKPVTSLRKNAGYENPQDSQALFGDILEVFEIKDGWAWVKNQRDQYVGYCPADHLANRSIASDHMIISQSSLVFPEPDIKKHPVCTLPLGAQIKIIGQSGKFSEIKDLGWIYTRHISPLTNLSGDFVSQAEMFQGTPYLWGGSSYLGIDCSGLVQVSMLATGKSVERDSDRQENSIGMDLGAEWKKLSLDRGDLIFWPGHVGIMTDPLHLLHANATDMKTAISPLDVVAKRVLEIEGHPVRKVRRPEK